MRILVRRSYFLRYERGVLRKNWLKIYSLAGNIKMIEGNISYNTSKMI